MQMSRRNAIFAQRRACESTIHSKTTVVYICLLKCLYTKKNRQERNDECISKLLYFYRPFFVSCDAKQRNVMAKGLTSKELSCFTFKTQLYAYNILLQNKLVVIIFLIYLLGILEKKLYLFFCIQNT